MQAVLLAQYVQYTGYTDIRAGECSLSPRNSLQYTLEEVSNLHQQGWSILFILTGFGRPVFCLSGINHSARNMIMPPLQTHRDTSTLTRHLQMLIYSVVRNLSTQDKSRC